MHLITICRMDCNRGRLWAEGIMRRFLLKFSPKIAARGLLVHMYVRMMVGAEIGRRVNLNLNRPPLNTGEERGPSRGSLWNTFHSLMGEGSEAWT